MARTALEKAKARLSTHDESDILDAALYLRMAIEALTYERAVTYVDDLGPEKMKTWQPKQLMLRMLEVDPQADQAATLSVGVESTYGETPETMTEMGTDRVFDLVKLKTHYDALGSYLHTPTLGQLEKNKPHDMTKLRCRCDTITEAVEMVLSSPVWAVTFKNSGKIECLECGQTLSRRIPNGVDSRKVECWECNASYTMSVKSKRQVAFEPCQIGVRCVSSGCEETTYLWERDFQLGTQWDCRGCGTRQYLAMGVTATRAEDRP